MFHRRKGKKTGKYKSRFEAKIADYFKARKLKVEYEADSFPYTRPSSYTPDWKIGRRLYIESKGYFAPSDRAKLKAFKAQYPEIEILLLFANSGNRLNRKSKMTYGEWAESNGFRWADFNDGIPKEWFNNIGT